MPDSQPCPMCPDGEVVRSEGRLDQCGETYLPTVVWGCTTCGYARYEPATGAAWRGRYDDVADPAPLEVEPLRAA